MTFNSARDALSAWAARHTTPALAKQAEAVAVRRDMVTLMSYVRDCKVVGAAGTGNMSLKDVRSVTARFVKPPQLEAKIGDKIFRIRSAQDLWPLYFLNVMAEAGGLIKPGPSRRWRLTKQGESFLSLEPLLQVPLLLSVWWFKVNWVIAYPYTGMGKGLPYGFSTAALDRLRALKVGTSVSLERFAKALVKDTGLTWGAPQADFADRALRGAISRMIIYPLADFDAIECGYRDEPHGKTSIKLLDSFTITPLGRFLLAALEVQSGISQ